MLQWLASWALSRLLTGQNEVKIPVSVKGHKFVLTIRLDPATGAIALQTQRSA